MSGSSPVVSDAPSAARRASGRTRKQPETFTSSPFSIGKRKRNNEDDEDGDVQMPDDYVSDDDVKAEASGLLVAGTDTTAISLTYLVWAVLKQPDLQRRLEEEVATLEEDFGDAECEKLPLLGAVVQEEVLDRAWRLDSQLGAGLFAIPFSFIPTYRTAQAARK